MSANKTLILDHQQIQQKVDRIARQIYENNYQENDLIILGIEKRGAILAERLAKILSEITEISIHFETIKIDKDNPLEKEVICSANEELLSEKTIILIDDVLNTGKALIFAARYVLGFNPKSLQTVTLVDRRHRNYPIRADYVGLTLATTLKEHISVEFGAEDAVYLV